VSIDESDYPIRVRVVSDTLMKHELLNDADFLDTVQITINTGEVVINASKPVPEEREVRELSQLSLESDEVNSIDVTHVLNTEHRNAIKSLIDEHKPYKTRETELKMTILVKDDEPVYQTARRLSPIEREREQMNAITEIGKTDSELPAFLEADTSGNLFPRKSFARLKEILYDNLILNLYEVGTESELHTDASVHGYDALAEKQWRQVYYEKPHPRRRDTRVTN